MMSIAWRKLFNIHIFHRSVRDKSASFLYFSLSWITSCLSLKFYWSQLQNGISRMLWHCRELAGISGWEGPAPDCPELGWRLVTRVCSSHRCQHEPSGGTGAWSQAGDGGGAARYQSRIPGPGHTSSRKEESELCPRLPGHHRVTILGWSWGQRRGCEITDISDVQSPIITRGQVTGPMVSATRGETRPGTSSDQSPMFRLNNVCIVWVR